MKVSQIQKHITTLYKAGCRHTIFLQGPPGIGKSESVFNATRELDEYFKSSAKRKGEQEEDFGWHSWQATIVDPLELPGLPAIKDGKAYRAPFEDMIPTGGRGLLCIDEINSAPTLTQGSFYSLIWEGKLGGAKLGKDWMIVATGNQAKDNAVTQRMPTPLVSRMEHITVEPDLESWLIKMAVDGADEAVRAFIKVRGMDMFSKFDPEKPGPFPCPRSWVMVSKVIQAYTENGKYKDVTPPFESICGWVSEPVAVEFMTYYKMAVNLVDPEDIIRDPEKAPVPKEPGQLYAVTTALASKVDYQTATPIIRWLNRLPGVEFAVYCIASAREVERGRMGRMSPDEKAKYVKMQENSDFKKWCLKHHDLIVNTN